MPTLLEREPKIGNESPTLTETWAQLISDKQRAAAQRSRSADPKVEKPRTVFLAGCEKLAEELNPFGYFYAKSGPKCALKYNDWVFEIHFRSDHHNVAGEYVGMTICGVIRNSKYLKWRRTVGSHNPSDVVSAGKIGYFCEPLIELKWNLADAVDRPNVIVGAFRAIQDLAFPYFERFRNLPTLKSDLQIGAIPMIAPHQAIDILMWCGSPDEAARAAVNFLKANPEHVEDYSREITRSSERQPLKIRGIGIAKELAITVYFHGLEKAVYCTML